jgi:dynein heavy chain 2, cytosolic
MEQKAERKQEIEALQRKCTEDEQEIHERKMLVEDELKDIQPEVDKAKEAVGKLSSKDINEIRSYMMPPDAVADVL